MTLQLIRVIPPLPSTERGQFCSISCDKAGERLLYCSGTNVIWRQLAALAEGSGADKPDDSFCWNGHTKKTTCASMSPNGQWVVSGDASGAIRVWGAKGDHIQKNEYKLWAGVVKDVGWSDDSGRIVAAGDGNEMRATALIWDTGSKTGQVEGHTKQVNSISFRPQRPFRIATAGEDMMVAFHQGPPFKFVRSHKNHSNFVNAVRYSPDGAWFVSVGSDSQVILYEGKEGELVKEFEKPKDISGSLWGVAWSPDSARFATCGGDKKVRVWDREAGAQVAEASVGSCALPDMQVGIAWPGSDSITSVCLDGRILLWDGSLKLCGTVDGTQGPLSCVACDKKTGALIYGGQEGVVAVAGQASTPAKARIGKGISHIITHSEAYAGEPEAWVVSLDDCVRRLSVPAADVLGAPVELKEFVTGAGWLDAAESKLVVATSKNSLICISDDKIEWSKPNAVPRRPTALATLPGGLLALAIEKTEGVVAGVANSEYDIQLFEIAEASVEGIREKAVLKKHSAEVTALRFSPSGEFLASSDAQKQILVWSLGGDTPEVKISDWVLHTTRVTCLDWLPDSRKLLSGSLDQKVFVWNVDDPKTKVEIKQAHQGGVSSVAGCPDGSFASVGFDGFVRVHKIG